MSTPSGPGSRSVRSDCTTGCGATSITGLVGTVADDRDDRPGAGDRASRGPVATDHADEAWLRAWARGEPGRDVDAHAATVFELLRGRACFARIGLDAVGIAVPHERLVGMFCIAVDPERRRAGLGTAIVAGLLTRTGSRAQLAYLQVDADNEPARAMYGRLGFSEAYRYCHQTA